MGAPDFFFAVNAIARHLHDRFGKQVLIDYWRTLGREYYRQRIDQWRKGGAEAIARDWREYFSHEPGAEVDVSASHDVVELNVLVCPAIKHLREQQREIVPYFCEHCDHVTGAMADLANCRFDRTGGMGSCRQTITRLTDAGRER